MFVFSQFCETEIQIMFVCLFSVSSVIYLSDINISTLESSCDGEVILMTKEEIIEVAEELCKILKYEFIFVPVSTFFIKAC